MEDEMSLSGHFKTMTINEALRKKRLPGIVEICQTNVSYLIKIIPERINPRNVIDELKRNEELIKDFSGIQFQSRLIDLPTFGGL